MAFVVDDVKAPVAADAPAPSAAASSAAAAGSPAPAAERTAIREDNKVVVSFRHAGNAPILKQSKFKLPADVRFQAVTETLRSHLRMGPEDALVRPVPIRRHPLQPDARACRAVPLLQQLFRAAA